MKMAFLSLLTTHSAMLSSVNQLCLPGQAKIIWSPCYSRGPPLVMPVLVPLPSQDGPVCLRIATKNSSVLIECIKKSEISNIYSKNTINHFYPNVRMHRTKRHAVEAVERGSNISLHSFTSRPLARFKPSGFLVEIRIMYEFWCIVL